MIAIYRIIISIYIPVGLAVGLAVGDAVGLAVGAAKEVEDVMIREIRYDKKIGYDKKIRNGSGAWCGTSKDDDIPNIILVNIVKVYKPI